MQCDPAGGVQGAPAILMHGNPAPIEAWKNQLSYRTTVNAEESQ
jgi:tRNA G37 N-methylase TrmD